MIRIAALTLMIGACAPTGKRGEATGPSTPIVPAPRLIQPASPSPAQSITLQGYATPGHRIEVYINSVLLGDTITRADGLFEFRGLLLRPGLNLITATAVDDQGNRSETRPSGGGDRPGSSGTLRPEVRVEFNP